MSKVAELDGLSKENEQGTSQSSSGRSEEKKKEEDDNLTKSFDPEETEGDECSTEEEEDEKVGWLEKLHSFFAAKLKLEEKEDIPQVLEEVSVDGIASYILSGKCKNIVTMAGAGISTSAGIPDFRSPKSGLYANLGKYDLPHPEAVFEIEFFRRNPKPFFVLAKDLYPGSFRPTASHRFVRLLHDKGLLLRHYTQNIDTLEHVAGIPAEKLVEAHGTFRTSHCLSCQKEYTLEWIKEEIFADKVPWCGACGGGGGGVVKPDIVFFGESLPPRFFELMGTDFKRCDLLVVMGTSLTVQPFASLVDNVPAWCPRVLINRERVTMSSRFPSFQSLLGGSGSDPNLLGSRRDVSIIGDCDDGCRQLADKLGWKEDLEALEEEEEERSKEEPGAGGGTSSSNSSSSL